MYRMLLSIERNPHQVTFFFISNIISTLTGMLYQLLCCFHMNGQILNTISVFYIKMKGVKKWGLQSEENEYIELCENGYFIFFILTSMDVQINKILIRI